MAYTSVHAPAEGRLRRRGECDRSHTGDLRRDDVHDDARGIDGLPAGHVEPHASDRLPPLLDDCATREHRRLGRGHLGCARDANACDRALDRVADLRRELVAGSLEFVGGHANVRWAYPVESLGLLDERHLAVLADRIDEHTCGRERGRYVGRGARHEGEQFAR
jgi:hypothetical protein